MNSSISYLRERRVRFFLVLLLGIATFALACNSGSSSSDASDQLVVQDDHEGEEEFVQLTLEEIDEFNIGIESATSGELRTIVSFPGEVKVNQDRLAHVVPRIAGFVHEARKSVGDAVRAGEVLAVLDSRELADTKSDYLANLERIGSAEATFNREENLFQKKISSEQEYLDSKQILAERRIALRSSRQKLLALGFSESYIDALPKQSEHGLVHYQLTAPISGVVIEKHISQGEALSADSEAFVIADLRTVWVDLNVFQKDLDLVREGQAVEIVTTGQQLRAQGTIQFVRPIIGEDTRTAIARILLDNTNGRWKPGLFVNGSIVVDVINAPLVIPKSALISMGDRTVVFTQSDEGFAAHEVTLGRENTSHAEITAGLSEGDRFVARGGFTLKAELEKSELGEGHGH